MHWGLNFQHMNFRGTFRPQQMHFKELCKTQLSKANPLKPFRRGIQSFEGHKRKT
jgi:hypothetical protein